LSDTILTKLGAGRVSQVRTLTPNFTVVVLKMCQFWRLCGLYSHII